MADRRPCELLLRLLSGRGTLAVLSELNKGGRRYHDLFDAIEGISAKVLTETLRKAKRDGLVTRHLDAEHIETAIGAGASNGRQFYRYYACRKQQSSGRHGCGNLRVPADPLEDKVLAQLLDIMSDYDLFEEAARAALEKFANERPRIEAEKASTDAQLGEVTKSLNTYW